MYHNKNNKLLISSLINLFYESLFVLYSRELPDSYIGIESFPVSDSCLPNPVVVLLPLNVTFHQPAKCFRDVSHVKAENSAYITC